jgi:hypothetical protein
VVGGSTLARAPSQEVFPEWQSVPALRPVPRVERGDDRSPRYDPDSPRYAADEDEHVQEDEEETEEEFRARRTIRECRSLSTST